jgi:hypothetical protein
MVPFRKLALGGGGSKGLLQIGALRELAKYQSLEFPDGVYGCSVGSIVATCICFRIPLDDKFVTELTTGISYSKVLPKPTFQDLTSIFANKGMFDMKQFEEVITEWFSRFDIDIRSKRIGDTEIPLYIVASNITKGVPTVFSKSVPILDALKCSCCIPGVFKPQELYGQLYVDGGLFLPSMTKIAPDSMYLHLNKLKSEYRITPQNIASLSPVDFIKDIYVMAMNQYIGMMKNDSTVELEYPELTSESDFEDFDIPDVLDKGALAMRRFLTSKGLLEESSEVLDGRLS